MWQTALILGVAGSLHCVGMCSPLMMVVTSTRPSAVLNRIIYNSGRILVYAIMGSIVASAGVILPFHKYQNLISIVLGSSLVVIGYTGISSLHIPGLTAGMQWFNRSLRKLFGRFLKRKSVTAVFILGCLNGFLPCGLTMIALAWCLTLQGPIDGFNFMLLFGAGTLPVMLGFTGIVGILIKKMRWNFNRLTSSMLILSGFLLIARVFFTHLPQATADKAGIVDIILCN